MCCNLYDFRLQAKNSVQFINNEPTIIFENSVLYVDECEWFRNYVHTKIKYKFS